MNDDKKNEPTLKFEQPYQSNLRGDVIYFGSIIFIILVVVFIIIVYYSNYKPQPKPIYTNKYLNSQGLDNDAMSYASTSFKNKK